VVVVLGTTAALGTVPVVVVTGTVVDVVDVEVVEVDVVGTSWCPRKSDGTDGSANRIPLADPGSLDRPTVPRPSTPEDEAPATTPVVAAKTPTAATRGDIRPFPGDLLAFGGAFLA
jgi:hypothetical protein